jgi:hypothetical protein
MIPDPETRATGTGTSPGPDGTGWLVLVALLVIGVALLFAWLFAPSTADDVSHFVIAIKLASAAVGFFAAALGIAKTLIDAFTGRPLAEAGPGALLGIIGALLVIAGSQCLC